MNDLIHTGLFRKPRQHRAAAAAITRRTRPREGVVARRFPASMSAWSGIPDAHLRFWAKPDWPWETYRSARTSVQVTRFRSTNRRSSDLQTVVSAITVGTSKGAVQRCMRYGVL